MKKKTIAGLIAIVVIAAIAMFAGCIEKEEVTPSTPTPIAPTSTPAPSITPTPTPTPKTELSLSESTIVDGISFTVVKYEFTDSYEAGYIEKYTHRPPEGAKYLWVYVKAKNIGELAYYTPGDYRLLYKGEEISYTSPNPWFEEKEMYHGWSKIYPDVTEEGWILYEVPKGIDISQAKIRVKFEEGKTMTWSLAS